MADVRIRTVTPDDWRSHRDLRLEMLKDAPDAFWTQYADVADLDEGAWRERLAAQCHFQAMVAGVPSGSVGLWEDEDEIGDDVVMLVAMYVAPSARGRQLGEGLVQRVVDEAGMRGRRRVVLEVTINNAPAIGLYQRMGFSFNGERRPHPRRHDLEELVMERPATPVSDPGPQPPRNPADMAG